MEEVTPTLPDFRIVYVSDGEYIANKMSRTFSWKYKLAVERHDLQECQGIWSSAPPSSPVEVESGASISVLVTSPGMLVLLDQSVHNPTNRNGLIKLMKADQLSVTLSCQVDELTAKNAVNVFFNDSERTWEHLNVGGTEKSFQKTLIELISMLETWEEMPLPTLKKYCLLSDKPVLARDTVYIQVEKNLVGSNAVQSLNVIFKNGHQVTAPHVTDNLYQLEAPESSESSTTIDVFMNGELLGRETIIYRDKLQVFADVYNDILNLEKVETPHANEEVESMISDWLTSSEKLSSENDIQELLAQLAKFIKLNKGDVDLTLPLMPLFVYFCTKFDQNTLAQLLLGHMAQLAKANVSFKEECLDEDPENEYDEHDTSAEFLDVKDEDAASYSSGYEDTYAIPEDIVIENRCRDLCESSSTERKETVSEIIPRPEPHNTEREPLSKSCPSMCAKHDHVSKGPEEPVYGNIPFCEPEDETSTCTLRDSSASIDITEPQIAASEKPASFSETQVSSRAVVNEKPVKDAKDKTVSKFPIGDNGPDLPPRRRSDSSKEHNTPSSKNVRRLSLACLVPQSTPPMVMSSSTMNLTKLCDPKSNLYGQHRFLSSSTLSLPRMCEHARVESTTRFGSVTSPDGNSVSMNTRLPPIPYSCRPSPPIPKPHSCNGVCLKVNSVARQQSQQAPEEVCCHPENISNDSAAVYSSPIYYSDNRQSNGSVKQDSCVNVQNAVIHEGDEEEECQTTVTYDVPRKQIYRSVSADVAPASPRSSVPVSPISPDAPSSQKKSSRSSPWSSFKLSLRKNGKSKRLNTKL